jgi:hypothetical protein
MCKKTPLFIHIPKTGGRSIQFALKHHFDHKNIIKHSRAAEFEHIDHKNYFTFTFVRNPYDRIVSAHQYLINGLGNGKDIEYGRTIPKDFKKFVKNILRDSFRIHFRPIKWWIDRSVDFIGRYENLQTDFSLVCKIIGVESIILPRFGAWLPRAHYSSFYDQEAREIVTDIYKDDIEYYDYTYEEKQY